MFVGLLVVPFFQPDRHRFWLALCYVMPILAHDLLFGQSPGNVYFLTDAAAALLSASLLRDGSWWSVRLQEVCLAAVIGNFAGWVAWYAYMPSLAYEVYFLLLYGWALWILTIGTGANVAIHRNHRDHRIVRPNRT